MAKVAVQPNGCWLFTGSLTEKGYGRIKVDGSMRRTHVVMFEDKYGPIPEGKELDHFHCHTRACCHPDHAEPVTHSENIRRAVARSATWGWARLSPSERTNQARVAATARWGA